MVQACASGEIETKAIQLLDEESGKASHLLIYDVYEKPAFVVDHQVCIGCFWNLNCESESSARLVDDELADSEQAMMMASNQLEDGSRFVSFVKA